MGTSNSFVQNMDNIEMMLENPKYGTIGGDPFFNFAKGEINGRDISSFRTPCALIRHSCCDSKQRVTWRQFRIKNEEQIEPGHLILPLNDDSIKQESPTIHWTVLRVERRKIGVLADLAEFEETTRVPHTRETSRTGVKTEKWHDPLMVWVEPKDTVQALYKPPRRRIVPWKKTSKKRRDSSEDEALNKNDLIDIEKDDEEFFKLLLKDDKDGGSNEKKIKSMLSRGGTKIQRASQASSRRGRPSKGVEGTSEGTPSEERVGPADGGRSGVFDEDAEAFHGESRVLGVESGVSGSRPAGGRSGVSGVRSGVFGVGSGIFDGGSGADDMFVEQKEMSDRSEDSEDSEDEIVYATLRWENTEISDPKEIGLKNIKDPRAHPVAIKGEASVGNLIEFEDISPFKEDFPCEQVAWYLSVDGTHPLRFLPLPFARDVKTVEVKSDMISKFIQVRVVRLVKQQKNYESSLDTPTIIDEPPSTMVTSYGTIGPVNVSDFWAWTALKALHDDKLICEMKIHEKHEDLPEEEKVVSATNKTPGEGFCLHLRLRMTVTNEGVSFEILNKKNMDRILPEGSLHRFQSLITENKIFAPLSNITIQQGDLENELLLGHTAFGEVILFEIDPTKNMERDEIIFVFYAFQGMDTKCVDIETAFGNRELSVVKELIRQEIQRLQVNVRDKQLAMK
eukprot:GHVL01018158.1.p1 GENE.GHVL01018158.1~~GHVL01018158.1.p1  ORF type:complete len:679 (+),score=141.89 GHVL01018158.1:47-2083(+)